MLAAALELLWVFTATVEKESISCLTKHSQKPMPPTPENIIHRTRRRTETRTGLYRAYHSCRMTGSQQREAVMKALLFSTSGCALGHLASELEEHNKRTPARMQIVTE